jgi:hypothetical protein
LLDGIRPSRKLMQALAAKDRPAFALLRTSGLVDPRSKRSSRFTPK